MAMEFDLHIGLLRKAWKFSCVSRMLSVIKRLAIKVDWVFDIRFESACFSLLHKSFEMIF